MPTANIENRAGAGSSPANDVRTGLSAAAIKQSFLDNLICALGRPVSLATANDAYTALALTIRDRVLQRVLHTIEAYRGKNSRAVAYLSAEFLPGPHLANHMLSLGISDATRQAMPEL